MGLAHHFNNSVLAGGEDLSTDYKEKKILLYDFNFKTKVEVKKNSTMIFACVSHGIYTRHNPSKQISPKLTKCVFYSKEFFWIKIFLRFFFKKKN